MKRNYLIYNRQTFSTLEEMCETLLTEANEQLVRIDFGELRNEVEARNEIRWKLMHIQRAFKEETPLQYRSTYNSLWSQLYRLDHQDEDKPPLLRDLLITLMEED